MNATFIVVSEQAHFRERPKNHAVATDMSLKRPSSSQEPTVNHAKRFKPTQAGPTLTSYLHAPTSLRLPAVIAASAQVEDRDSQFIANAAAITAPAQADIFRRHVREQHACVPA
jgi:hypothetical protein